MFDSLVKGLAHILSWMFVVGMAGSVFLVIPVAAYQLFKVLFRGTARRKPIPQCLRRGFARFSSMINSPAAVLSLQRTAQPVFSSGKLNAFGSQRPNEDGQLARRLKNLLNLGTFPRLVLIARGHPLHFVQAGQASSGRSTHSCSGSFPEDNDSADDSCWKNATEGKPHSSWKNERRFMPDSVDSP